MRDRILSWAKERGRHTFTVHEASRISGHNTSATKQCVDKLEQEGLLICTRGNSSNQYRIWEPGLLSIDWRVDHEVYALLDKGEGDDL